jgi:xanthine dehydrogenase accessory factor
VEKIEMPVDVFQEAVAALADEEVVVLATVIGTSGSTPASVHARMLVKEEGRTSVGTVGGGRVERAVALEAQQLLRRGTGALLAFDLDEAHPDNEMLCGGSVEVLLEPLTRADLRLLAALNTARSEGRDSVLARVLAVDGSIRREFIPSPGLAHQRLEPLLPPGSAEAGAMIRDVLERFRVRRLPAPGGEVLLEPVGGTPELIVFGGGHIGKQVAHAASTVGFRITVVDDRADVASAQRFPEADQTLVLDYATAFRHLRIRPSTYIVIVTRGHEPDELVLEQALATSACYIGMIGSKRKVRTTFEHLDARGVHVEQLERVHAPIGMDIGAITPEEIAISIVAELIRLRRRGPASREGSMSHAASNSRPTPLPPPGGEP